MQSHDRAAAAGPKLVRPDGEIDRSVRGFPYPGPIAWDYPGPVEGVSKKSDLRRVSHDLVRLR